ncbi:BON domain-containing protein [Riemerella anatipestifer]|uniref:BON domain-containing protein n=1 Tax=Riemerella anatipestifer TaxID=34085 RepID=UPI0007EDD03F|nr:BON domain-containing protein [Riemerella anatipestifer]AZZ58619.1 BON domain-containing protein [Riemerella anatipestifer]MCO7318837.1 BON domain-containing protein [Riemerella anatipestifer]MCQ4155158.1 BON domain-containing protein [Riemerella anatipestifer]MCQ4181128.1 BON domain-containing protein [Riemerella anatipestifer]MCW0474298.1 BON domain-containing protein [Riemerella anatipestifer]
MKKIFQTAALAILVSFTTVSCKKKPNDAELSTKATEVVKANPQASVEVKDGQAHLSGVFASQAEKDQMIASLKAIPGIKDVHDMTTIETPEPAVTVNQVDAVVLQKVKDATKDFPSVKVEDVNGELTLTGNVSSSDARKIKESVDALKIGKYNNQLTVK